MVGKHILVDFYGVTAGRLTNPPLLTECLQEAARCGGMHPVALPVLHCFEGGGVTACLLLSESHIALHTYPELGYIAVDLFLCGRADVAAALKVFRVALVPMHETWTEVARGNKLERTSKAFPQGVPDVQETV